MKYLQYVFKEADRSCISCLINWFSKFRLDHFQIPGTEIIPHQFIDQVQRVGYSEFTKMIVKLRQTPD